jgi:hypothetical protein
MQLGDLDCRRTATCRRIGATQSHEALLMPYNHDQDIRDPDFYDELRAIDHRPYLTLELPPVLSDEAARQFSNLLQSLADEFYTHYCKQIQRACRARAREREEFLRGQQSLQAQQNLPFGDELIDGEPF